MDEKPILPLPSVSCFDTWGVVQCVLVLPRHLESSQSYRVFATSLHRELEKEGEIAKEVVLFVSSGDFSSLRRFGFDLPCVDWLNAESLGSWEISARESFRSVRFRSIISIDIFLKQLR
ncbi:hypothetical protein RchiOBHm_Chr1g0315331 [Rosa chinensis]|uniref:Uncharacterized protein n=1 Tax=Rosa chinensis TaxID=74649 RepID=A0A2P6S7F0_ROSCH|nr:hypothetical protein RchiOBHm_Chr1g0315331 [Rosa chinensis]